MVGVLLKIAPRTGYRPWKRRRADDVRRRHSSASGARRLAVRFAALLLLPVLAACPDRSTEPVRPVGWHQAPVSIQGRIAEDEPDERLIEATIVGEDEVVYLYPGVAFTTEQLQHVETSPDSDPLVLQLWFTEQGAEQVTAAMQQHVGRRFALLVNGHVVAAPPIVRPLRPDPQLPVSVQVRLAEGEAEQLADAVARTWPPREPQAADPES
jgi:hypothetical protein